MTDLIGFVLARAYEEFYDYTDEVTELSWPPREVTGPVEQDGDITVYVTGGTRNV